MRYLSGVDIQSLDYNAGEFSHIFIKAIAMAAIENAIIQKK